ncbi:hypothetical protein [Bradyrhizobium sp. AUGA SZCCT0160]|uniref:hypothetical protein n=1 Tax=Bradyrhizobium sp. AUGA SZCCT0160 TaxID=2807662 RepID=UPI001BAA4EC7|nr:hypothetical protein [Bradyrhizobium sp. AUGA SZCCT0160]MBR1193202.1 hypothetical protein [Bradyrhizobium sp. AUGA SZCCT0160]
MTVSRSQPSCDDLRTRCEELLGWSKTGLLAGGKGGVVRALAERLRPTVGDVYALSVAEAQTKDEAMAFVVSHASLKARIEALEAALRFYACDGHWMLDGQCDPNSSRFEGPNVARAALEAKP